MSFEGHLCTGVPQEFLCQNSDVARTERAQWDLSGGMRSRFGFSEDLGSQRFCTRGSRSLPNHPILCHYQKRQLPSAGNHSMFEPAY